MTRRYCAEDIALIMELQADGISYKRIAQVYCCSPQALISAVYNAKQRGMQAYPSMHKKTPVEQFLLDTGVR